MRILEKRGSTLALVRSKIRFSLLLSLILCLMMVPLASADLGAPGTTCNSRWAYTIPTINGAISAGEWTDATVRDFTLEMRKSNGSLNQTLSARFYVKNDLTNIYAAVQIFNDDYDAQNVVGLHYDTFALFFEDDHDHVLENGDNGVGIDIWNGSWAHLNNDWYWHGYWDYDFFAGKTNDGAFNWSHTYPIEEAIGNYTFEMRIPLVGSDGDDYDLAITTLPATVGFKIWFRERDEEIFGVYPDDPAIGDNSQEIGDGSKFGNLILHPRYTLTITTTAGGTTSPAPGPHTYGWGEVATVSAIPNPGYVLDHWELDGSNVGAPNPISVTMYTNHTLRAVFRLAPPPAVGGTAAPIVVPINKPASLAPLIWLASTIIFPIAVTVVFVKLKKKKR